MREINPQTLLKHARRIELQIATSRLLTYLFTENGKKSETFGRYQFLEKEIEERPEFLQALLKKNHESALRIWRQVLADHKSEARFYHGLAVMYREQAVASLDKDKPDGHFWLLSTSLWVFLLCAEEFWKYFSEARFTERDSKVRQPLKPQQQDSLFYEAWQSILLLHNKFSRQNFDSGRYEQAKVHLRCLDLCRKESGVLIATLNEYGMLCNFKLDKDRLQQVRDMAEKLLNDWGSTLVKEAEKATEDADAIKNLPKGIRKNYEGGIHHLENFIKLDIHVVRVLRTSLQWYNDWCLDLYVTKDMERVKELMQSARPVADRLTPSCIKGRGYTSENQALSQHFLFRGFTADEPEHAIKEYEEALAWNPENDNAKELLGGAAQRVLMKQVETAIECVERKQFKEAFEVLNAVEKHVTDKKQLQEARAVVCFRHAHALADDGKFRDALTRAREAQQLLPYEQAIQSFVKELEAIAPEEDNLRHLRRAQEKFEKEHYDIVIEEASQVSRKSKFHSHACTIQSAAYFYRGIAAAKRMQFDEAIDDLEQALAVNDKDDERNTISGQLEIIQQNKTSYELKQEIETKNWNKAEQILRQAISGRVSSKVKREFESQLSNVLNAHAVSLANEMQEVSQKFGEALQSIITGVKSLQEDGLGVGLNFGFAGGSCAVCGQHNAKVRVMLQIINILKSQGSFSAVGLEQFWQTFRDELCFSCKQQIDSINNKKREAMELLEEAVRLDRNNKAAKKNLEALIKY
jgi:tetratricopeptide (TPR) repeat protein